MTEQQHPITPPPELVEKWRNSPEYITGLQPMSMVSLTTNKLQDIATQAARWGYRRRCLEELSELGQEMQVSDTPSGKD